MKTFVWRGTLPLITLILLTGCAGMDRVVYDNAKRAPKATVDIYQDGKQPARKFRQIAAFMTYGLRDAEVPSQKRMLAEAQQLGADGIIFVISVAGVQAGPLGAANKFAFKGIAIVYE